jgi:predicted Zn finger-like uncharacterized protein
VIVTCERCETQFQLDDARVPPAGVRVRCSRCKHAFQVMRSVGRSLADAQAAPPQQAPSRPGETDDEESDWQFNDDLPSGDPDASGRAEIGSAPSPAGEAPGADAEFGWDSDDGPAPERDLHADSEDDPFDAEGLSQNGLDLLEDLDRSAGTRPQPAARAEAKAAAPAPTFPVAEVAAGSGTPAAALPRPASEIAAEADAVAGDELASPDDWDLFSDVETAEGGVSRKLPPVVPAAVRGDEEASAPRWARWLDAGSHYVGGSLVAALFLYGLAGAWPASAPAGVPPRHALTGDLEIAGASGRWVENAVHGPLYVVSGSLWNSGSRSVPPPTLRIEWLDRDGRVLERSAADASAPRRREKLREAPLPELAEGPSLAAGGSLPPGAGLPFELVLEAVPPGAAHFQLVASATPPPRTPSPARASATAGVDGGERPALPQDGEERGGPSAAAGAGVANAPPMASPGPPAAATASDEGLATDPPAAAAP